MCQQSKDKSIYQLEEFLRATFRWPEDSVRPPYSTQALLEGISLSVLHFPKSFTIHFEMLQFPQYSFRAWFGNTHAMSCLLPHRYPHPNLGKFKWMYIRQIGSHIAGQSQIAWAASRQRPLTNSAVKMNFGIWTVSWKKRAAKLAVITQCSEVGTHSICSVPTFGWWMQRGCVCRPKHRFDCTNMRFRSWLDYKTFSRGLSGQKSFFSSEVI